MDWQKGEESENLEDRRRLSPQKLAVGGGIGVVVITLISLFLGVDPQQLQQFLGNAPGGGQGGGAGVGEERPLTPEEERSRKFNATILRFTEVVWDEQFRKIGERYEKPHMVLFSHQVETGGCENNTM